MKRGINILIGERIKMAREEASLNQKDLSERLGFKDRQILSNIESGTRKVSADELLGFMKYLNKTIEYFTDPYLLVGKNLFSWRADEAGVDVDQYETRAKKVVGAFCQFSDLLEESPSPIMSTLAITRQSSFEDAVEAAETLVQDWALGEIPAERLSESIEKKLNMHIICVDAPAGISGAAYHKDRTNLILINRNEPSYRRNYDLAHEIFHLLTWDNMQPKKIDVNDGEEKKSGSRIEQLADNFASALLIPEESLRGYWEQSESLNVHERIVSLARNFKVSGAAMYYRLKNIGLINRGDTVSVSSLKYKQPENPPRLYSEYFVKKIYDVIDKGLVSVKKVAELLDCNIEDIEDLFHEYDVEVPFDL